MTLRHLKIFIAVAETKSMSAAARRCFITQPTVSQTIHELEEHYHTILFERLSRKLYITEAGKNLLSHARQVIDQFEQLEQSMASSRIIWCWSAAGITLFPRESRSPFRNWKEKILPCVRLEAVPAPFSSTICTVIIFR